MKITLTIILLGLIVTLNAQSYIRVSNNPGAVADYPSLQAALDAAPVGWTIFVDPSSSTYGNITIKKRVTLLGGGYDATKHNNKKSEINHVTFDKQYTNPNKTVLSGLLLSGHVGTGSNAYNKGIDSITIQRCQMNPVYSFFINGTYTDSSSGWKIFNNKLNNINGGYSKNILISNNILSGQVYGFDQYSIFITNNIFHNSAGNSNSFTSYSNNIFYSVLPSGCSSCTFSNNITVAGYGTLAYGDNICSNNKEGTATTSIFVSYPSDLHLKAGSPGINAGSDGTDIGIYGGFFPWPSLDYGITGYPEIMSLNITNPVIEPNGTLRVNVKSKILR